MKIFVAIVFVSFVALAGCQSKQANTDQLQKEYQQAHKQYVDDCVAPMTSGAGAALGGKALPTPSLQQEAAQQQKCDQEARRAGDLERQIQANSK